MLELETEKGNKKVFEPEFKRFIDRDINAQHNEIYNRLMDVM